MERMLQTGRRPVAPILFPVGDPEPTYTRSRMSLSGSDSPSHVRFHALLLPHLDVLLAFARHRTATEADAEDLVQETFVRAWQGLDDLRDDASARAWLFRILRRLLSDHHRNGSRKPEVDLGPLLAAHEERIASPGSGPLEDCLSRLSHERARRALDRIPDEFAMAVALHDIAGFRYREIAEILEVPLGTVMSRIHRGRKMLAECMAGDGSMQPSTPEGASRVVIRREEAER